MSRPMVLRVRIEPGIPKLLVKINPVEAEGCSAKNLGEVMLRKASAISSKTADTGAHRGHVAVLHMSYGVQTGELLMSLKLAEILDVEEDERVEVAVAPPLGSSPAYSASGGGGTHLRKSVPTAPAHSSSSFPSSSWSTGAAGGSGRNLPEVPPSSTRKTVDAGTRPQYPWSTVSTPTGRPPIGGTPSSRAPAHTPESGAGGGMESPSEWMKGAHSVGFSNRTSGMGAAVSAAFDGDWLRGIGGQEEAKRHPERLGRSGSGSLDQDEPRRHPERLGRTGSGGLDQDEAKRHPERLGRTGSGGLDQDEPKRHPERLGRTGSGGLDQDVWLERQRSGNGTHSSSASGMRSPGLSSGVAKDSVTSPASSSVAAEWLRRLRAFADEDPLVSGEAPMTHGGVGAPFDSGRACDVEAGGPPPLKPSSRLSQRGADAASGTSFDDIGGNRRSADGSKTSTPSSRFFGGTDFGFDAPVRLRRHCTDPLETKDDRFTHNMKSEVLKSENGKGEERRWFRWEPADWDDKRENMIGGVGARPGGTLKSNLAAAATAAVNGLEQKRDEVRHERPLFSGRANFTKEEDNVEAFESVGLPKTSGLDLRAEVEDVSAPRAAAPPVAARDRDRIPAAPEGMNRCSAARGSGRLSSVWDAPTPQRGAAKDSGAFNISPVGRRLGGVASLEPSPVQTPRGSCSAPSSPSSSSSSRTPTARAPARPDPAFAQQSWASSEERLRNGSRSVEATSAGVSGKSQEPSPTGTTERTPSRKIPSSGERFDYYFSTNEPPPTFVQRATSFSPDKRREAAGSPQVEQRKVHGDFDFGFGIPSRPREGEEEAASAELKPPTNDIPLRYRATAASGTTMASDVSGRTSVASASLTSPEPPPRLPTAICTGPVAIVPAGSITGGSTPSTACRKSSGLLRRKKTVCLGALQQEVAPISPNEHRQPIPSHWRPPTMDPEGGGLERSELGNEVTDEVRRWLIGETSGSQCSQVVLDRALTVLSNFKLASGCQLEVLGGPLGAIVGGYSDADWLHDEVFKKQPADAIRDAFGLLGFRARSDGNWSNMGSEEVSLTYRRLCLRGHPSRGGAPRSYLKLQVAMELVRAFCGEAGPLESVRSSSNGFILDDMTLVRELQLTAQQAEEEATKLPQEQLEEMNRALDEYILRQMCFKSEIVDEIARLHEDSAYAILGVSSSATDGEIKKAYRLIAMQCHPDKGGDKEDFQELNNAYEKIMEQRRGSETDKFFRGGSEQAESDEEEKKPSKKKDDTEKKETPPKKEREDDEEVDKGKKTSQEGASENEKSEPTPEPDDDGDEGSNASLLEKASKAAEEASRYAKTAAEFAHQAAEAAETARRGNIQGSRETLTKSIAHSAIVLTLTVVKAVRVVGYATLDVAAQCRIASKRNPAAAACAERAVTAMSLGLEALNAALACAEVTETTAAELQAPQADEEAAEGSTAAAERFVGAAVRASLAAASASNAAMSAAIAAVEGSRECIKAVEATEEPRHPSGHDSDERRKSKEKHDDCNLGEDDDDDDDDFAKAEPRKREEPQKPRIPTPEEVQAAAMKRLVSQRNNNHKVLQRLNAEILTHQQNVRQFLRSNRQLIPIVTGESKRKVFKLLRDYAEEASADIRNRDSGKLPAAAAPQMLKAFAELSLFAPFMQQQSLAISVSVKARLLKMAALYDLPLALKVITDGLFTPIGELLRSAGEASHKEFETLVAKICEELSCNVAES